MVISHSRIHDIIARAKSKEPLAGKEYHYKPLSREEVLALGYTKGERVKDKITGKGGEVIAGIRATVTKD